MIKKLLNKISAERSDIENDLFSYTFIQHQRVYDFCKKYIKNKNVLEAGCGSGFGTYRLADYAKNIIGIDVDEFSLNKAKEKFKKPNLSFILGDITSLGLSRKFDVIISLQVIEHIEEDLFFVEKLQSMLETNGLLILSTPNRLTSSFNENPYHVREYSFKELQQLLKRNFKSVKMLGLHGNKTIRKYEKIRRAQIEKFLSFDLLKIRKNIPLTLKKRLFDIASTINRYIILKKNKNLFFKSNDFVIKNQTKNALDIIAICKN